MKTSSYIHAIDQGTSSTKEIIFNPKGKLITKVTVPIQSFYPEAGYVEQDPEEIYQSVLNATKTCLQQLEEIYSGAIKAIVCCGISNQRETFVLWDKNGTPLHNAVVWQCKRSIEICNKLQQLGLESEINKRTGLKIDPNFSGTKLIWLYENDDKVRTAIDTGKAYFGTIDSWLLLYKIA